MTIRTSRRTGRTRGGRSTSPSPACRRTSATPSSPATPCASSVLATDPSLHTDPLQAFRLDGRVAVVTGAAKGIGRQTAITLAQAGARVVVADVDAAGAGKTAQWIGEVGAMADVVPTDVSQKSAVDALAERALADHGRLDIWVNVAGIIRESMVTETTERDIGDILGVNLVGTYWGCAAAARIMVGAGRGAIVNVASAAADMGAPSLSVYAMSKAGIVSLTKTLAMEVGPKGVRVNAVAPGFIDTPMTQRHDLAADGTLDEEKHRASLATRAATSPLGLTGEPSDIALCILYLVADASRFVTGQVLRPNGGVVMP